MSKPKFGGVTVENGVTMYRGKPMESGKATQQEPKPQTKREWALQRCKSSCQIGRGCYDGVYSPPQGHGPTEYAIYCLLRAVEELAIAMEEQR